MKRLALALAFIFWAGAAFAQYAGIRVVTTCGASSPWPALQTSYNPWQVYLSVDTTMTLCTIGGGGGGGGNVTIVGPLGPQTAAGSVATTINGTLPAFTSTPMVNLGTLGGAATQTTLAAILANANAVNVTATDCSGTVTTGGTAQSAITAQTTLHGFTIANTDASAGAGEPLWISFTTTASAGAAASYPIAPPAATTFAGMGSYTTPVGFGTNHAVSVVAPTTGHKFSCTWW